MTDLQENMRYVTHKFMEEIRNDAAMCKAQKCVYTWSQLYLVWSFDETASQKFSECILRSCCMLFEHFDTKKLSNDGNPLLYVAKVEDYLCPVRLVINNFGEGSCDEVTK